MMTKRALCWAGSVFLLSGCLHDWSRVGIDASADRGPDVMSSDALDANDAVDTIDAPDGVDAADATDISEGGADGCIATCDGGCCDNTAAQPWAPWNGGVAGSRTPTLRWTMPPAVSEVVVQHCPTRACFVPTMLYTGTGDHYTIPTILTPGDTYYWRVVSTVGTTTMNSSVFEFEVGGYGPDTTVGLGTDFNGDGDADLVVGSPDGPGSGSLFYYAAGPGGAFPATPTSTFGAQTMPASDSIFAQSVSVAGDLNGDGYVDLATGQSCLDPTMCATDSPADAFVFFTPFGVLTDLFHVTVHSGLASERFGRVVAGLGDVDGDGYADVAVGAPGFGAPPAGAVFVYRGGSTVTTPIVLNHPTDDIGFGSAIAGGDIDGDGRAEIVVGAPQSDGADGRVYVCHWNGSDFDLSTLPLSEGSTPQRKRGISVAVIGDVDGDGFGDIAVGEPTPLGAGRVTIWFGASTIDTITRNMQINSANSADQLGRTVSRVGDFNGDGSPDIAIGSPVGAAPIVQVVSIVSMTATTIQTFTFTGSTYSGFGASIAPLGDINGDGRGDLAIGGTNGASVMIVRTSTSGAATTSTIGPESGHNRYGASLAIQ